MRGNPQRVEPRSPARGDPLCRPLTRVGVPRPLDSGFRSQQSAASDGASGVRIWDYFRLTPRLDADEVERVQTMSRARYAARMTAWTFRAWAVLVLVTWIVRGATDPAFRARLTDWRLYVLGPIALALTGLAFYVVNALVVWPRVRRTAMKHPDGFE